MRYSRMILAATFALAMVGCASTSVPPVNPNPSPNMDLKRADKPTTTKLQDHASSFVQADLKTAAALATANGFPARAQVYTAIAQVGMAVAGQVAACEAAIKASLPSQSPSGPVGVFTAFEMAAEAVGTGIPAAVKVNCEPIPLPSGLPLGLKLF